MAEPIRGKGKRANEITAPTPQNTPATNAPISSHAQNPSVGTIAEALGDEGAIDAPTAASIFAQNPALIQMVQGRLGKLIGRSSGYIESLPAPVKRRVSGLKGIQKEHTKLEAQFQEEVLELEKKFFAKFSPLYQKRNAIVNGGAEPTEEEVKAGEEDDDEEEAEEGAEAKKPEEAGATQESAEEANATTGIPEFWLSAVKNHASLAQIITDRDEEALKHLIDIRMEYLDKPGFRLIFEFSENEFFTNKTLSKTYFYQAETGYGGDFIYDHAEGDKIEWAEGKDLTFRVEAKKQRNKTTKQTRIVKRQIPTESFFNFFSPPKPPAEEEEDDEDEDATSDIEERLEFDYQLGEDIKEKLIPHAIDWFTGEALAFEELEDEDLEEDYGEGDSEDFDDDIDESDESDDDNDSGKPKQDAAECKQS